MNSQSIVLALRTDEGLLLTDNAAISVDWPECGSTSPRQTTVSPLASGASIDHRNADTCVGVPGCRPTLCDGPSADGMQATGDLSR